MKLFVVGDNLKFFMKDPFKEQLLALSFLNDHHLFVLTCLIEMKLGLKLFQLFN